ncbi:hypothetical protein GE118_03475 [Mycoplasma sp. NEAQ87857]|uniref:hypothetical protein n=1 Tax=Mycoplasma sp. NEAQ87857 TaxID=2683967 RepID=UPI0013164F9E|nr:hypothetical protein [Mycoplasma sp. NEAQ87857]QGZ97845.1 hypothetical protein GE118_03475 [Mycoplasma sp. NEAQ87857]
MILPLNIKLNKNYLFDSKEEKRYFAHFKQEVNNKLSKLAFNDAEFMNFEDIAYNFKLNGIHQIINFCNLFYELKIHTLIIFCSEEIKQSIQSCINFLLMNQINNKSELKIKLIFINQNTSINRFVDVLNSFNHKIGLLYLDTLLDLQSNKMYYYNQWIINFLKQEKISYEQFYIGKDNKLIHKLFNEKHILLVSEYFNQNYSIFSEVVLVILATQGINIKKIIDGYVAYTGKNNRLKYLSYELASFWSKYQINNKTFNVFASCHHFLNDLSSLFAFLLNKSSLNEHLINTSINLPSDISSLGQYLLDGNHNKIITYLDIKRSYFDFQFSDNVLDDDMLDQWNISTINQYYKYTHEVFNTQLTSFNKDIKSISITCETNNEIYLGALVSIFYFAKIYYCLYNNLHPFK